MVNPLEYNFFDLLGLKQEFDIDKQKLEQNYIKLQELLHPDKFTNKSSGERNMSLIYTTYLNNAYDALKDDQKRAQYLLSLHGIIINQEENNNVSLDSDSLEEIFEISEARENYNLELLKENCFTDFRSYYTKEDFAKAAISIIKLQYLKKL